MILFNDELVLKIIKSGAKITPDSIRFKQLFH
jgi:hypothetical protein